MTRVQKVANGAIEIAERYFALSNRSNLAEISKMFSGQSTYSSASMGVYLGVSQIMEMMTRFHDSFKSLKWDIAGVRELRPGVVELDFTFQGVTKDGQDIRKSGLEYIVVSNDMIQHVEVRNKI